MDRLLIIGGVLLLLAGLSQSWLTVGLYRLGRRWRGSAIISGAFVLWGVAVLSGMASVNSPLWTVLVWVALIAMWVGLWQRYREQARQT